MKSIHRLMVTSSTYRMRSTEADPKNSNLAVDGDNRYLWRMNPRRMEAETVRDSLLQVAGQLDSTMIGGPELDETRDQDSYRRSVYFRHSSESQVVFLKLFDAATPEECYERNQSIVPQQALALANSRLSYNLARLLTRRLRPKATSPETFIATAVETVLGRRPSAGELVESKKFLLEQAQFYRQPGTVKVSPQTDGEVPPEADPDLRAQESLVHVLFNRNEFVTIR